MKENIDEIFNLAVKAKAGGQKKIPVHIFPINYYNLKSIKFFENKMKENPNLFEFEKNIFDGFLFFDENLSLPKISVDKFGKYIFE
jgi:hypothetical protein